MGATPPRQGPLTAFSPDGFWWWDGAQWRPAISADRLWRWNGQAWVRNTAVAAPGGGGAAAGAAVVTVLAMIGVLVLVSVLVIVILLTMGNQLANVFSNVVAALGAEPSPSP